MDDYGPSSIPISVCVGGHSRDSLLLAFTQSKFLEKHVPRFTHHKLELIVDDEPCELTITSLADPVLPASSDSVSSASSSASMFDRARSESDLIDREHLMMAGECNVLLICLPIDSQKSQLNRELAYWKSLLLHLREQQAKELQMVDAGPCLVFAACKCDLWGEIAGPRVLSERQILDLVAAFRDEVESEYEDCILINTSSKTKDGVQDVFELCVKCARTTGRYRDTFEQIIERKQLERKREKPLDKFKRKGLSILLADLCLNRAHVAPVEDKCKVQ